MTIKTVAILLPSLHFGGAERASLTLARAMQARGVAVDLLLMQKAGQFLDESVDLNIVDLCCDKTYQLPLALWRYLQRCEPDLLICNFWKLALCACVARIFHPGCKLAIWEHAKPSDSRSHSSLMYGLTSTLFYRMSTTIVAVSRAVRADILSLTFGLTSRTTVINNPIPEPFGNANVRSADFIFVGRLDRQKNPMLALEAFAIVSRECVATMAFVGDGELREVLERRSTALSLSNRITFTGFVTNPAAYMRTARVLVLSSDSEGLGNVIVEALHCGLGVVSTDCGGPRDLLGNQRYGRIVPVRDALALAEAMAAELENPRDPRVQQERARQFSPDRVATEFLASVQYPFPRTY